MPAARLPRHLLASRWLSVSVVASTLLLLASPAVADMNSRLTPVVKAVQEASPAVVNIHGRKTLRPEQANLNDQGKQVNGMGTGIILDPRGYIITNYHVIEGVSNVQVTLADQKSFVAKLVAHDPKTDLAVIKITTDEPLPVIRIGTSSDLMRGEKVIAVGNAFGYEHTVTEGIVSALHRTVQVSDEQKYVDLIQTDASINPGNSGGPLMNVDGQTIGINVAVRVGAQGIGFAIPIDEALEVASKLLSVERLEGIAHGADGKTISTPDESTFNIKTVRKDSAAEKAGLKPGDIVLSVGDHPVERRLDFELGLIGRRRGEELQLEVQRDGTTMKLPLVLAEGAAAEVVDHSEQLWTEIGVKLAGINEGEFRNLGTRYRGGLKVTAVRTGGPAAGQGIRAGDVLVGMHIWETVSMDNVSYILQREDLSTIQPLKFFIVRGNETLYGHLRVARK